MRPAIVFFLLLSSVFGSSQPDSTVVEKSPGKALLYSLIPGGGQVYNGKYLKAVLIVLAEGYVTYQYYLNRTIYIEWDPHEEHEFSQQRYLQKRNKYAWWMALVYIYNLLDALVDSHLSTFDQTDPELQVESEFRASISEPWGGSN